MATLDQADSVSITELLSEEVVETNLQATDRGDVFDELVGMLVERNKLGDAEVALNALREREDILSTGIGNGLAIPHAKVDILDNFIAAFARVPDGVDFKSLDGKPAHLIFLLLSPQGEAGRHVRILARISRILKNARLRPRLMEADTASEILDLIREEEENL